jgi:hypothetical protein
VKCNVAGMVVNRPRLVHRERHFVLVRRR